MKVLVVEIEGVEFSEEGAYRIALQGKVFSDVAASSSKPDFQNKILRVPFAVVRDGKEVLVATIHKCVTDEDGEETFERVGQGAVPLKAPGKNPKDCKVLIEEGKESSIISGSIKASYKLIKITMRESLRGGTAPVGINVHGGFFGGATPVDTELHLLHGSNLIGTGKLPAKKPGSFLEVSDDIADQQLLIKAKEVAEDGTETELQLSVRAKGPMMGILPTPNGGTTVLALQPSKIVRDKKFKGIVADAQLSGASGFPSQNLVLFLEGSSDSNMASADEIEAGFVFGDVLRLDDPKLEAGPKGGVYVIPHGDGDSIDIKKNEMGVIGFMTDHDDALKVMATVVSFQDADPEETSGVTAKVLARGALLETNRADSTRDNVTYDLEGILTLGREAAAEDANPEGDIKVTLVVTVLNDPVHGLADAERKKKMEELAEQARENQIKEEEEEQEDYENALKAALESEEKAKDGEKKALEGKANAEKKLEELAKKVEAAEQARVEAQAKVEDLEEEGEQDDEALSIAQAELEATKKSLESFDDMKKSLEAAAVTAMEELVAAKKQQMDLEHRHEENLKELEETKEKLAETVRRASVLEVEKISAIQKRDETQEAYDAEHEAREKERAQKEEALQALLEGKEASALDKQELGKLKDERVSLLQKKARSSWLSAMEKTQLESAKAEATALKHERELMLARERAEVEEMKLLRAEKDALQLKDGADASEMRALRAENELLKTNVAEMTRKAAEDAEKQAQEAERLAAEAAAEEEAKAAADLERQEVEAKEKLEADRLKAESEMQDMKKSSIIGKFKNAAKAAVVVNKSVGGHIAEVMASELKEKQKVLTDVMADNRRLQDALQVSGKDIVTLRLALAQMATERKAEQEMFDAEKRGNKEAADYTLDLVGVDLKEELGMVDRQTLEKVTAAVGHRVQEVSKECQDLRGLIGDAKAARLQFAEVQRAYKDMQEAHVQQAKYIQKLQKQNGQLDKYKSTIETQERIITKMQGIVESRLRDAGKSGGHGHGAGHHHHDLHGLMPQGAIGTWMGDENVVDQKEEDEKALEDEINMLREENETLSGELEEALKFNEESLAAKDEEMDKQKRDDLAKLDTLKGDNMGKDVRITALEDQLRVQAHEASHEVSRLRTRLFEIEIGNAIKAESDENTEFDGQMGFNFAHALPGGELLSPGVFGRDPSVLQSLPPVVGEGGVPALDFSLMSPGGAPSAGGGINAAQMLAQMQAMQSAGMAAGADDSGSKSGRKSFRSKKSPRDKAQGAARRASVMMSMIGGTPGSPSTEGLEKMVVAMAASEALNDDSSSGRGRSKNRSRKSSRSSSSKSPRDKSSKRRSSKSREGSPGSSPRSSRKSHRK